MTQTLRNLFFGAVIVVLSAPLFIVAGVSVNEKKFMIFPPRGFSFRWYTELFEKAKWSDALVNSLVVATSAGVVALSIALPIAYFMWRYRVRYAKALYALGLLPFALPPVITALGMLLFWAQLGHVGTIENIIIGQLAEKVRSTIAERSIVLDLPSQDMNLTVSVGVNVYSGDANALFAGADDG